MRYINLLFGLLTFLFTYLLTYFDRGSVQDPAGDYGATGAHPNPHEKRRKWGIEESEGEGNG